MRCKLYNLVLVSFLALLGVSCATTPPVDDRAGEFRKLNMGLYTQRVDNFLVPFDASGSMRNKYNKKKKLDIARNFVSRMNQTIPDIKLKGAIRTFGRHSSIFGKKTELIYGVTDYNRLDLESSLMKIKRANGNSPISLALDSASQDLANSQGEIAVIVVSDGKETDKAGLSAAKNMKAQFGKRICIYTVLIGDSSEGKSLLEEMANLSQCGFSVTEESVASPAAMEDFVRKVFLTKVLDRDGDGVIDTLDRCPNTPTGVKVDSKGCPLDTDGDGVYDYLDECSGTSRGVKVDSKGCPLDTDGDGVYDHLDQCPGTLRGVRVDSKGCPLRLDKDGDGVYDDKDQCPRTPRGVKVDSKGCPLDTDKDGVYDYLDKCPKTPKDAKVNDKGCWVLKNVEFDTDKWNIKPHYQSDLDEVSTVMKKNPSLKIEIHGHTDNVGTENHNKVLSKKRALSVMDYLLKKGIMAKSLSWSRHWFSKPKASNETEEGRARNRRVEIHPVR